MPKKDRKRAEESSESESDWTEDEQEEDSDAELQLAFQRGELKHGLNFPTEAKKPPANNKERLAQKLEEIRLDLPWIERLDVSSGLAPIGPEMAAAVGIDPNVVVNSKKRKLKQDDDDTDNEEDFANVDDDFKRELRFYRQAQWTVLNAIPRLHALGVPTKRPDDYFAEMAKSDDHMKKIRGKLIEKQQKMELSEKAKKLREQRKYGKQVQQEVLKKRQEEKKRFAENVKKYRKGDKGQNEELDFLTELEEGSSRNERHQDKGKPGQRGLPRKSGKQKYKDTKFGFGGRKKRSKYNTKESADDVDRRSGRQRNKGPSKRPNKIVRQKMKNKNKRR